MRLSARLAAAVAVAALLSAPAAAHEFVVKPSATAAAADQPIDFQVLSTHVFLEPEEMEKAESVTAALVDKTGTVALDLAENAAAQRLDGRVAGTGETAWLTAHRLGQIWSKTAEGWIEGGRDVAPEAEFTNTYEKFAKVLINAEPGAEIATRPVGQLLEIVPLGDLADARAGEPVAVQVLFDGQPVEGTVSATFDGFSDRPNTYAYLTQTTDDAEHGPVAVIEPWQAGLWMVRVEHRTDDTPGIDEHVLRSVMVFEVR